MSRSRLQQGAACCLDVCEVVEAKGLEFDYVAVPDADAASYPAEDDSRRALHVAATRAMHQLWFCTAGTPSPVLPWGREE
jgi:DNA helicase-2/ATP-dependent DNA helicase PcrA